MKFLDKLNYRQLLEESNFQTDKFIKSLLANDTYVYRRSAEHAQVWESLNKMSVTKYPAEVVYAKLLS